MNSKRRQFLKCTKGLKKCRRSAYIVTILDSPLGQVILDKKIKKSLLFGIHNLIKSKLNYFGDELCLTCT